MGEKELVLGRCIDWSFMDSSVHMEDVFVAGIRSQELQPTFAVEYQEVGFADLAEGYIVGYRSRTKSRLRCSIGDCSEEMVGHH